MCVCGESCVWTLHSPFWFGAQSRHSRSTHSEVHTGKEAVAAAGRLDGVFRM